MGDHMAQFLAYYAWRQTADERQSGPGVVPGTPSRPTQPSQDLVTYHEAEVSNFILWRLATSIVL
jgi:hypothetical protein